MAGKWRSEGKAKSGEYSTLAWAPGSFARSSLNPIKSPRFPASAQLRSSTSSILLTHQPPLLPGHRASKEAYNRSHTKHTQFQWRSGLKALSSRPLVHRPPTKESPLGLPLPLRLPLTRTSCRAAQLGRTVKPTTRRIGPRSSQPSAQGRRASSTLRSRTLAMNRFMLLEASTSTPTKACQAQNGIRANHSLTFVSL